MKKNLSKIALSSLAIGLISAVGVSEAGASAINLEAKLIGTGAEIRHELTKKVDSIQFGNHTGEHGSDEKAGEEGKCGEGKCGDKDGGEGSCGDKDGGEGSCGDKDGGEGSCGDKSGKEGSCGDKDGKEGKCGEGKCG